MEGITESSSHRWHVAINKHNEGKHGNEWDGFMYKAKQMMNEIPRLTKLFGMERKGELPKLHKQCSRSEVEKIMDNHLTCCIGVECRKCEVLLSLEKIDLNTEAVDEIKAWTCAVHIVKAGNTVDASEGFILTTGDKMYWDTVYKDLDFAGCP